MRVLKTESILFIDSAIVFHPWVIRNKFKNVKDHFESTLIFLNKHPEYKKTLNAKFYFTKTAKDFFNNFLKNSLKYKFKGANFILIKYLYDIKYGLYLFLRK